MKEIPPRPVIDPANGSMPNVNLGYLYDVIDDVAAFKKKFDLFDKRMRRIEDSP